MEPSGCSGEGGRGEGGMVSVDIFVLLGMGPVVRLPTQKAWV